MGPTRLNQILEQIHQLESEIFEELHKKQHEYGYKIHRQGVEFAERVRIQHGRIRKKLHHYLLGSRFLVLLTTPLIYACLIPIAFLDLICSAYQWVCFPIYRIPWVRRSDYISFDRHHLQYLNLIEKINCEYCAYANGILAYCGEIANRTEQYWCPIKHFKCMKCDHKRYKYFLNFGDGEGYIRQLEDIRRSFQDVRETEGSASG